MKNLFVFFTILFLYSCNPPIIDIFHKKLEGKYHMVKKGFYKTLDFKDENNVIIIDNLGFNMSFSTTYKIYDNVLYIKSDQGDLVYNINGDILFPQEGSIYSVFAGTFAREGSRDYEIALSEYKREKVHLEQESKLKPKKSMNEEGDGYCSGNDGVEYYLEEQTEQPLKDSLVGNDE